MSKKKVSSLDVKRKKRRQEQAQADGFAVEHWYELVEYFDPEKIETINLPQTQGYRSFVRGVVKDLVIVEVPSSMPSARIKGLAISLGEMGFKALIVSDNVKFMKLRPCSAEESELLDEADPEKKGRIFAPTRNGNGAGSESDGVGGSGARDGSPTHTPGGDQDDSEDAHGGEAREDP